MNGHDDDVNLDLMMDIATQMRVYELAERLELVFYLLIVMTVVILKKRGHLEKRAPVALAILALGTSSINYVLFNSSLVMSISEQTFKILSWVSSLDEIFLSLSFVSILRAHILVPQARDQSRNDHSGGKL